MTVGTLSDFLAELAKPLDTLPNAGDSAHHLREVASAFRQFSAQTLPNLVTLLHKAEEYRKSGLVAVDPEGVAGLRTALEAVQKAVGDPSHDGGNLGTLQDAVAEALVAVGKSAGLQVAKPKKDTKWATTLRNRVAAASVVEKLKGLAARIKSLESLDDQAVADGIGQLSDTAEDVLKAAAVQVGVSAKTKSKGRELILAALAVLTNLPLDKKPKTAKATAQADDATVLSLTSELKDMAARATSNPHSVTDEDIEAILKKVESSGLSDQQAKDIALAVTGVKEKSKTKAFLALRGKLTAAKRILEDLKS